MRWIIAAILITTPFGTSACGGNLKLTPSTPMATFKTPNYPGAHTASVTCSWAVSAPLNVDELKLSCDIHTYGSSGCNYVSFSFINDGNTIRVCGTGKLIRNLKGSANTFTFKSSLWSNYYFKGVSCTVSYIHEATTTSKPTVDPSCSCGQKGGKRIVGGNEATPNEYPWQVLVMYKSSRFQFCGGSVIAREWVMSASHCFSPSTNPSTILLSLGEHDHSTTDSISQDYEVTQVIMHENYNKPGGLNNDIALLKLAKPITFNQYISPICLPFNYKNYDFTDKTGITSGWGLTVPNDYGSGSKVLKEIDLKLVMSSRCNNNHGYGWAPSQVNENMICGIAQDGGSCQGDSGGPMTWKSLTTNHYFQLGIVSFGSTCASKTTPTVYAFVPKYIDWIIEKTGANGELCLKQ